VIVLFPSLAGAVNVTVACPLPGVALTLVGALGTVALDGVTGAVATEDALVPTALLAVTVKVYAVPLTSPVIKCVRPVVPALLSVPPAGLEVTA